MEDQDKSTFLGLLSRTMGAYGKGLPEGGIIAAWLTEMRPFPIEVIDTAMAVYRNENGQFAPVPAGIAKICRVMDGRPSGEEAWAIALTSLDESDTVVWTNETAAAFAICRSVFDLGDEVGARMAFKESYARLISDARSAGIPAQWSASLGWDGRKRESAIGRAHVAGLLTGPVVAGLLPNFSVDGEQASESPEGLKKIKELMAELNQKRIADAANLEQKKAFEREAVQARKDEIYAQVKQRTGSIH
jgi:hypothetical protein